MKKNTLKKSIMGLVIGAGALMTPYSLPALAPSGAADECAKELLLSYFPEPIVTDTLKRFAIPQEKWADIIKSLASKDKEVVKIVEEKAATMNPNPLKDAQQRQAAVKLFRDTLLQVFSDALKENGVTDTSKFQAMLDDIQQQKAKRFAMCMERQKTQAQSAKNQASVPDDDENDDDDDEDEDEGEDELDNQADKSKANQSDIDKSNADKSTEHLKSSPKS